MIVRRRFIGDANGVLGMRGSNMFQTARTMVFADGIPLHYHLQTRWSGAPRWGLVNADELGFVEVVYGPFSAEYGGGAMGGVINIETRIPTARQLRFEGILMQQSFDAEGFDDTLYGYKSFFSYGEKVGKLSVYAAYTRLDNDSQPQDFRFDTLRTPSGSEPSVTGSLPRTDEYGAPARYYGNSGPIDGVTDQLKLKIGYELAAGWLALFNNRLRDPRLHPRRADQLLDRRRRATHLERQSDRRRRRLRRPRSKLQRLSAGPEHPAARRTRHRTSRRPLESRGEHQCVRHPRRRDSHVVVEPGGPGLHPSRHRARLRRRFLGVGRGQAPERRARGAHPTSA